jgi:hypothetical protein
MLAAMAFVIVLFPASVAHATDDPATAATTVAPEPEPTTPPDGGESEDGTDESIGTAGVALIVLVGLAVLLVFLAGRGSARSSSVTVTSAAPPPPPPPGPAGPTRQERLRSVYTRGRMILDRFDDREVDRRRSAPRHLADDTRAETERTLSDIYELEADAPTSSERSTLRGLAESINGLDRSVDLVSTGDDVGRLEQARARLQRALEDLADLISRP